MDFYTYSYRNLFWTYHYINDLQTVIIRVQTHLQL
jgi:hypothetical protein